MPLEPAPTWPSLALVFVAAPAAAALALAGVHALLDRVLRADAAPVLRHVVRKGRRPARLSVALLAALAALPAASLPAEAVEPVGRGLALAAAAALGWTLTRKVAAVFDAYIERARQDGGNALPVRRRRTRLVVFRRLAVCAGAVLTAGFVLTGMPAVRTVGLSLFASAGVAGIVAGLAARPTVANLVAGLQLAVTQPVRIGDAVVVEGEWGRVEEIASTYIAVATWDQRTIVVPLSHFLERPFQNWTRNSSELLDTAFLYVDYSVPVAAVRAKVREILEATPLWDRRTWAVQVTGLREGSMEIRVLMSAADAGRMWDLRCHVREELVAFIAREYPAGLPRTRVELGAGLAADGQPAAKGGAAGTVQAGAIVCRGAAPVEAERSSLEAAV